MSKFNRHLEQLAFDAKDIWRAGFGEQAGALCCKHLENGIAVLLITSRDSGRWVIPKGNIEKHENARQAAIREAREEAGIIGKAAKKPLGHYTYVKTRESAACIVAVFVVEVKETKSEFPEAQTRRFEWVSPDEAARRVDEPELKGLFMKMAVT